MSNTESWDFYYVISCILRLLIKSLLRGGEMKEIVWVESGKGEVTGEGWLGADWGGGSEAA